MARHPALPCLLAMALSGLVACNPAVPLGGVDALGDAPERLREPTTTWLALGRSYLQINDLRLAKAAFIRSIRVEGATAAAMTGAGIAAERQGLLHEAKRYFERALKLAPSSDLAHNNLGAIQYKLGDYQSAKRSFSAAFAVSSGQNKVAAHNLGLAELALKRKAESEIALAPNPVPLQREGSSEYRLLGADKKTKETDK